MAKGMPVAPPIPPAGRPRTVTPTVARSPFFSPSVSKQTGQPAGVDLACEDPQSIHERAQSNHHVEAADLLGNLLFVAMTPSSQGMWSDLGFVEVDYWILMP